MMTLWTILASALAILAAAPSARGQTRIIPARATMMADMRAIAPGRTFTVGVLITIEPGWHVYWINPGDAGLATAVKLDLPKGFTAGPIQFPAPIRFMQSEEVVGYGYIDQVMLLASVTAPQTLPAGPITIGAEASWLCCREICLSGGDKLELTLPVSDSPRMDHMDLFDHWESRIPRPAGPESAGGVTVQTRGNHEFFVIVQWKQPPAEARFFPAPGDALRVSDISVKTEGSTTQIRFRAVVPPGEKLHQETMSCVVAYHQGNEPWRGIEARVPLTKSPDVAQPQE